MTNSPAGSDPHAALESFLAAPDWGAATGVVDDHPELREPFAILTLVRAAAEADHSGDTTMAQWLLAHAAFLCDPAWPQGPDIVASLAAAYGALQQAPADPATITAAVEATRRITAGHAAAAHPVLFPRLLNITSSILDEAYAKTGDRALLDEAVRLQRDAVAATPLTGVDRPARLNNLALYLADLYAVTGDRALLDEAVGVQREAVAATPPTSVDRPGQLNNLAKHLAGLYAATGDRALLDEAVGLQRDALAATPQTSLDRPGRLNNLAFHLASQYAVAGDRALLDEAVGLQRDALAATPQTSVDRPAWLNNLAKHLAGLYAATGDSGLLDEAVGVQREAVAATPQTSVIRPIHLNNLALHLAGVYAATGDRALLDEAVGVQREAVAATPQTSVDRPSHLSSLASHLAGLYAATGDRALLEEAVGVQREAVAATPPTGADRPGRLNNLANRLAGLYAATRDRASMEEAVGVQRDAVAATPLTSADRPAKLNSLAAHLAGLYAATGDHALLEEAVGVQREAVAATPPTGADRPGHLNNLAQHLAGLYAETGDRSLLSEAGRWVTGVQGAGPGERMILGRTRASLARQGDNLVTAAAELEDAYGSFDEEVARLRAAGDPIRLRDLAQRVDGLLGDLAATHIVNGDLHRALDLLEGDRVWLRAPDRKAAGQVPDGPVPVAWVVPSRWEVAVVTTADAAGPRDTFQKHAVPVTRDALVSGVLDTVNAVRRQDPVATNQAVTRLVELTSVVVTTFPQAPRLLVVPLGVAALLPYGAALRLPATVPLVEQTAITLAPSLAWALAAHRARPPRGRHVGVFHTGIPPLDLRADKQQFEALVGTNVLDAPTAEDVLSALRPGVDIGHFSCHGSYDHVKPLDSHLLLTTKLHLRAVLNHQHAPWLTNLSACETGIPDLQAVEQLVSFPTGFLLGGASHVFATLWPVGNTAATTLNGHAYRLLADGAHPADALRQAVQHLRHPPTSARPQAKAEPAVKSLTEDHDQNQHRGLNDLDPTHAFWWAPFVHYGSPS